MNPYLVTDDETEIDLLDLMRYLLRRIIWILLAGVVFAGIAGAYKYWRVKSASPDPEAMAAAETEYELGLEKYEQQLELISISDESTVSLIRKQEEYLKNSLYMQLDPFNVWKAQTLVQVVSDDRDFPAYHFEELYKTDLSNSTGLSELAEKMHTERAYLRELISVYSTGSTDTSGDNTRDVILRKEDYEDRRTFAFFAIQTIGDTRDGAVELMDILLSALDVSYEKYNKEHPHKIQAFPMTCVKTFDFGIRNTQRDSMAYTQALLLQMKDNTDKAALLKKPEEAAPAASGSVSKKSLLKYGLVGFVAGVFLMCLWFALRYSWNDKLVDYKDVERKGMLLKELGSIPDQGAAMAAANIRNFAGDRKKLFLTGMTTETEFNKACGSLKEYLSEYEIVYARDVLHDPNSREILPGCDAAVLIEQRGVTKYSDMRGEVTFLVNAGKEIVGVVII